MTSINICNYLQNLQVCNYLACLPLRGGWTFPGFSDLVSGKRPAEEAEVPGNQIFEIRHSKILYIFFFILSLPKIWNEAKKKKV